MRKNLLYLAGLVLLLSIAPDFVFPTPTEGWVDLIEEWKPLNREQATTYQFWLDSSVGRLMISLDKPSGGVHNRCWRLEVREVESHGPCPEPVRTSLLDDSYQERPRPESGELLTTFVVIASNEGWFGDPVPEMYFRKYGDTPQFLVRRRYPTEFFQPTGFFVWAPGTTWHRSDRWGRFICDQDECSKDCQVDGIPGS